MNRINALAVLAISNIITAVIVFEMAKDDTGEQTISSQMSVPQYAPLPPSPLKTTDDKVGKKIPSPNRNPNLNDEVTDIAEKVLQRTSFPFTMGFGSEVSPIVQTEFNLSDAEVDNINSLITQSVAKLEEIEKSVGERKTNSDGDYIHLPAEPELTSEIRESLMHGLIQIIGEAKGKLLLLSVKKSPIFLSFLDQAQNLYIESRVGEDGATRSYLTRKWVGHDGAEFNASSTLIEGDEIAKRFRHLFEQVD